MRQAVGKRLGFIHAFGARANATGLALLAGGILAPWAAWALPAPPPLDSGRTLEGTGYPVPEPHSGSGYTALTAAADGSVYLGTAHYGHSARLLRFKPDTEKWATIVDAHQQSRYQDRTGLNVQGKFHAEIVIGDDGVVWAATKHGHEDFNNRPEYGEAADGFPGGHLYSYDPATGRTADHGILMRQEGLMGGDIDNRRGRLYYWSDPKQHFLVYDIATGSVRDMGALGASPRYTAIDPRGRVFGPARPRGHRPGRLYMYDPEADRDYDLLVRLEGPGEEWRAYVFIISSDGRTIYGARHPEGHISEVDLSSIRLRDDLPDAHGTVTVRHTARAHPGNKRSGVLGADGHFYFANDGHVFRYNTETREAEDLGQVTIAGQPDWRPHHSQGAAAAPDGTLYFKYLPRGDMPYILVRFAGLAAPQGGN